MKARRNIAAAPPAVFTAQPGSQVKRFPITRTSELNAPSPNPSLTESLTGGVLPHPESVSHVSGYKTSPMSQAGHRILAKQVSAVSGTGGTHQTAGQISSGTTVVSKFGSDCGPFRRQPNRPTQPISGLPTIAGCGSRPSTGANSPSFR